MRLEAVKALTTLYRAPDNRPLLREFTARFTPRFRELPYDVSTEVAVQGVRAAGAMA